MKKVLYEELLPEEFVQRMLEMPVAYLPLGTLEWHGPHMPLEADGIQSKELFQDYLRSIFAQLSRAGAYCRRTWTWTVNQCISGTNRRSRREIWSAHFYGMDICGR